MSISIKKYIGVINVLPVGEQAFTIKANNWKSLISKKHFHELFENETSICLSRQDIHNTNNLELFILKTILWGYPSGMRGKNFNSIYQQIDGLSRILNVPKKESMTKGNLLLLQDQFNHIKGLGLSTYSKFLYFKNFIFDGFSALILDERIIRIFNNEIFSEFGALNNISHYNSGKIYYNYIQIMSEISKEMETSPAKLEQFLFIFGNHLKPINKK